MSSSASRYRLSAGNSPLEHEEEEEGSPIQRHLTLLLWMKYATEGPVSADRVFHTLHEAPHQNVPRAWWPDLETVAADLEQLADEGLLIREN